jgi:hypothetical protein
MKSHKGLVGSFMSAALFAAAITGCSSSHTTGKATSASTSDGGAGPKTGDRGTVGHGIGGKDGGAPVDPSDACARAADDAACLACTKGSCCDSFSACVGDAECSALFVCAAECAPNDEACVQSCLEEHSSALGLARGIVQCQGQKCAAACGGGGDETTDMCLPDEAVEGATDCDGVAGKSRVRDCPGGSPGAACELAPTGAANVYCCPE